MIVLVFWRQCLSPGIGKVEVDRGENRFNCLHDSNFQVVSSLFLAAQKEQCQIRYERR